jgi:hypothetical protein
MLIFSDSGKENKPPAKKKTVKPRCKPTDDGEDSKEDGGKDEDEDDLHMYWFGPGGKRVRVTPLNLL